MRHLLRRSLGAPEPHRLGPGDAEPEPDDARVEGGRTAAAAATTGPAQRANAAIVELDDPPPLRPLTSHARIEGTALGPLEPPALGASPVVPTGPYQQHPHPHQPQHPHRPDPHVTSMTSITTAGVVLPQLAGTAIGIAPPLGSGASGEPQDEDTEAFKRAMWAGQANILVTVRLRPHCSHDRDALEIVRVLDRKVIVVLDRSATALPSPTRAPPLDPVHGPRRHTSHPLRKLRGHGAPPPVTVRPSNQQHPLSSMMTAPGGGAGRSREKRYAFDYVFTPEDRQQTVYHHTTKFLIHGVLNGFNATVFAYGCTGAGKTYTMLGTPDDPGIMALTLDDLFQNIARVHADPNATVEYRVTVSFLEVYNENIRDLLATSVPSGGTLAQGNPLGLSGGSLGGGGGGGSGASNEFLDLREDPVRGPVVAGISEVEASNALEVMKLLRRGNKHRSQEATAANAVSSRSHAVLQVLVEQREKNSASETFGLDPSRGGLMTSTVKYGKLSLVDLAGSERAAVTQNRGQRLIEGANINRSLLALGNCINALGEKGATAAGTFVPYRDSKLTRLLKDSLGGNCRTVMIANISPAAASVEETLNTLKYANRAKNIKTTVTRNVLNVDHHITQYATVISDLKDEIANLKKQLVLHQEGSVPRSPGGTSPRLAVAGSKISTSPVHSKPTMENQSDEEEEWRQAKLQEARGYIAQCFQQRITLKTRIFDIGCQLSELSQHQQESATTSGEPQDAATGNERGHNQKDLATSILEDIVAPNNADVPAQSTLRDASIEGTLRQLATRKKILTTQLERNETIMKDFREAIELSGTSNHLLREVLLMEYRVGELQVSNLEQDLRVRQQHREIGELKHKLSLRVASGDTSTSRPEEKEDVDNMLLQLGTSTNPSEDALDLPPLPPLSEMARLFSAGKPEVDDIGPETKTARSSRFPFLGDLRGRFHDRKGQPQPTESPQGTGGSVSPRRQWGIHLNNTSLPYIRLKKKVPPSLQPPTGVSLSVTELADDEALDGSNVGSVAAAPYLRVLKHRRKLQTHRSSSHKRLTIGAPP